VSITTRQSQGQKLETYNALSETDRSIFYPHPPPLKMAGFRPLKVLAAPFEEKNPKGSFFGGTFEKKFRRVHFLAASLI